MILFAQLILLFEDERLQLPILLLQLRHVAVLVHDGLQGIVVFREYIEELFFEQLARRRQLLVRPLQVDEALPALAGMVLLDELREKLVVG